VRCPGCSADVSALREFCPICGTAMDEGIRGSLSRGRQVGPGGGGKGLRKALVIGGGALMLALGASQFTGSEPWISVETDERAQAGGAVTIEAVELHRAYVDNPGAAAQRFGGREMVVSGEFTRIVPDGYGSLDLRLKTSSPDAELGVDVAQLALEDARQLRPGQRVTVSCQGMGEGGEELWVRECAIQPEAPVAPPSPPPEPPAPPEGGE